MLKVDNLSIKYNNDVVIKNSSLEFNNGTISAIIGKSGSGKTSILNVLALENLSSDIVYNVEFKENYDLLKRYRIAYLKQDYNFVDQITCIENMLLVAEMSNKQIDDIKINEILGKVQLTLDKKTYPQNLSGGEKKRFAIALALIKDADIILCDEITASLDNKNSQLIINILKDLAHINKKTVILTSHNEKIYFQCDNIYEIKNCEVKMIKSISSSPLKKDEKVIHLVPLKNKALLRYLLNKMKKQKIVFTSYLVLVSLIVSIVSAGFFAGKQFSNQLDKMLEIINKNQSFIMYTVETSGLRGYLPINPAIEKNELEIINTISEIEEITPYLSFDWPHFINTIDDPNEQKRLSGITFTISHENGSKQLKVLENMEISVHSNYHDNEMDYSCIQVNRDIEGLYLRKDIADALGITDISSPTEIEFDIYIPIASKSSSSSYRTPIYAKTTIKKLIRGILHPSYSHFYGNAIYLSYEEMNLILNTESSKHSLPDGYDKYTNNIYSIFTQENTNIEDIQNKLNEIDPHLYIHNPGVSLNQSMAPFLESEQYYKTYSMILLTIVIIISLVYSFLSQREYIRENAILKSWGITKKESNKLITFNILILIIITSLISTVLYSLIMIILKNNGKIIINSLNYDLIIPSLITILGLATLSSLCSHFSLFIINRRAFKK